TAAETKETTAADKETTDAAGGETKKDDSKKADSASSVTTSIHTYTTGNISVEYPVVSNLSKAAVQEKINKLLNEHALEFIKAYGVNESKDSLTVKCRVVSADRRRLTAVYTGSYMPEGGAHPVSLFYTNTIDTALGEDMGLTNYADPYTLAGYVLSGDCQFADADAALEKELMKVKNDTDIETYTEMFRRADFPWKAPKTTSKDSDEAVKFPEVFSYEDQGTIYVSIPVPHALGDFALIKYTPDTK
uniref:PdaC/SigV domain-containing protein n=1 Tax=Hungatella effluvii TaxID=1096246 RepID=UPI002A80A432